MELPNIYEGNYKRLIILPILLVLAASLFIPHIPKGVELKGGILVTVQTNASSVDATPLAARLARLGVRDVSVSSYQNPVGAVVEVSIEQNERLADAERSYKAFLAKYEEVINLEFRVTSLELALRTNASQDVINELNRIRPRLADASAELNASAEGVISNCEAFTGPIARNASTTKDLRALVESSFSIAREGYKLKIVSAIGETIAYTSYSYKEVSPSLSEFFIQKAAGIVLLSALLSMILVFFIFRSFIPSVAVLTGAASDVVIAMGAMGLFGIPLTLPSFAALLMLIGFSLDTDILLTVRTIKRTEGPVRQRAFETMKTGVTMSSAAIVAFGALFTLSLITHIPTYYQISAVAISGLIGDLVATWCLNAVVILWYLERKGVS